MTDGLTPLLSLASSPVAVTFRAEAGALPRVAGVAPSGCTYWKLAAEGRSFTTTAADHFNCPVGSHTHGIDLPAEKQQELQGLIEIMVGLQYLDPAEIAGIPRRQAPFGVAEYAPLDAASGEPDVVLVRANGRQAMLLAEAASAAGVGDGGATGMMGRPTCAAIPYAMSTGRCAVSLGCIGNRVYTGLGDDEVYFAIPGRHLPAVAEKLAIIVHANDELERFHRGRLAAGEGGA